MVLTFGFFKLRMVGMSRKWNRFSDVLFQVEVIVNLPI